MYDFDTNISVAEIKGILSALADKVYKAGYNLAFDNIKDLTAEIPEMRKMLDRIEAKVDEVKTTKKRKRRLYLNKKRLCQTTGPLLFAL